jgi:hypothetical protein
MKKNSRKIPTEEHLTMYLTAVPQIVKISKNKEDLRNCHCSEEPKEA